MTNSQWRPTGRVQGMGRFSSVRTGYRLCAVLAIGIWMFVQASPVLAGPPAQMSEDFEEFGETAGFGGGTGTYDNPGTNGVGGADDGFLRITSFNPPQPRNFAAADFGEIFSGFDVDYIESGITGMSFWLNDVGDSNVFEIHVSLGQAPINIWTTIAGFIPGDNEWVQFSVDFTDESAWTRTHDQDPDLTFQDALHNVERILFRHDLPPFGQFPDQTFGDLGIDRIELIPEPATLGLLFIGGWLLLRRSPFYEVEG